MEAPPIAFHSRVLAFAKRLSELLSTGKDEYLSFRYDFQYTAKLDTFTYCYVSDRGEHFSILIESKTTGDLCFYMGKEPSDHFDKAYNDESLDSVEDIARRVGELRRWIDSGELFRGMAIQKN